MFFVCIFSYDWLREISYIDGIWQIGYDPDYISSQQVSCYIQMQKQRNPAIAHLSIEGFEVPTLRSERP